MHGESSPSGGERGMSLRRSYGGGGHGTKRVLQQNSGSFSYVTWGAFVPNQVTKVRKDGFCGTENEAYQ